MYNIHAVVTNNMNQYTVRVVCCSKRNLQKIVIKYLYTLCFVRVNWFTLINHVYLTGKVYTINKACYFYE